MPTIDSAKQAVEIAKAFLEEAKLTFYIITKTVLQEDKWIVGGRAFGPQFVITVDRNTGEVIEYTSENPIAPVPMEYKGGYAISKMQ
ncbi:hypothetical protein AUJ95_06875 [Candidatus Desantisbacteria bacterium CG2_30_40_21]|uniref:PepSY domain-containing protein n=5 Tax=unclassified Candidatus Desantisiibacteriota TaxID=3106372 RepID=A0A2M7JEN7_9BACT|nr:MAG: hypothetical protein AUJ95_06875 [Candidatus Desantisbacteria bacterium CG2_30_40_21]PIP39681.1 MAG: hypothetical protein COX18_09280 [Candidatus Desantisbacteria bacterium CG23_combo_of_CG06-09_8_20_14_all_40_23]PIX17850.1 MAG: hypothetical protein COZ71_01125 [Candidatus Desantisbacteria bacterium CG_4_8_14_3_um_filter_40_12]PIY18561.1 MAG: hypothetical protein COZ13_09935 [Candidatus Desantisbacteria bacterium CG_4_10_14_3_um_filter_40_18]PJB30088.1 MAG: hypothetical protein CO110_02